jgi:hypothetical protein
VFGIDTHIDVIEHHGGTDPLIAVKVMMHHGMPKDKVGEAGAGVKRLGKANAVERGSRRRVQPPVSWAWAARARPAHRPPVPSCRQAMQRLPELQAAMVEHVSGGWRWWGGRDETGQPRL